MLHITNNTNFSANLYPGWNRDKKHQLTCIIKAEYKFDNSRTVSLQPAPKICEVDQYYNDPQESSLKCANEIMPYKANSELLLYGTAYPPITACTAMKVSLSMQQNEQKWHKTLYIFGKRNWKWSLFGKKLSKPAQLTTTPLRHENAVKSPTNPIGSSPPTIESGRQFINHPNNKIKESCFGAIPKLYQEKDSNNYAATDQQFTAPFLGGEILNLKGFFKDTKQPITLTMPKDSPKISLNIRQQQELPPICDTIIIDTDKKLIQKIWRASIPWNLNEQTTGEIILRDKNSRI